MNPIGTIVIGLGISGFFVGLMYIFSEREYQKALSELKRLNKTVTDYEKYTRDYCPIRFARDYRIVPYSVGSVSSVYRKLRGGGSVKNET